MKRFSISIRGFYATFELLAYTAHLGHFSLRLLLHLAGVLADGAGVLRWFLGELHFTGTRVEEACVPRALFARALAPRADAEGSRSAYVLNVELFSKGAYSV